MKRKIRTVIFYFAKRQLEMKLFCFSEFSLSPLSVFVPLKISEHIFYLCSGLYAYGIIFDLAVLHKYQHGYAHDAEPGG